MKAVVLAGGYATRLWPITKERAKPLLPLGEREIIDYILKPIVKEDRIDDIYISTNERFSDDFTDYLDRNNYAEVEIVTESTRNEEEKLGTVGALSELIERKNIEEDTLVIAGDNLYSFDISEYLDYYEEHNDNQIAAYDVGSREKAKQYGLVDIENELVIDFQEKPDNPNSTLVSIACYLFSGDTLSDIDRYISDGNNPDAPGYFIEWLQKKEDVRAYTFDGDWFDVGTPDSYLDAYRYVLGDEALISRDSFIDDSEVNGATHLMDGADIEDSVISNSIVFPNAEIKGSVIENSIIDNDVVIDELEFSGSVVGSNTNIYGD